MKARKLFHYKDRQGEIIVEMVLWALPMKTKERPHGLKYRLFCGSGNECIVRYDNETSKGDHRHYGEHEEPYSFVSVAKLIEDFRNDCTRISGWRWE
ncbi:MAG: hypothetical protein H6963_00105 [Chromatiaceae bacterium]|nr:hypothetical protein [Chromatiaceae bacterium]MCP5441697.1 hypothetical protein [Chromatiaceae bacterium]